MNRKTTKEALNIPLRQTWVECMGINYNISEKASQWIYSTLKGKYRMMHYSGTTDGVVPTIGTEAWMNDLGWNVTEGRKSWMVEPKILGGYSESREGNLDFITIHGCGHMAPQWKRKAAYVAMASWLLEKPLPRP